MRYVICYQVLKMKRIQIGDKTITEDGPIFFVAEIGINHNGSVDTAKRMIDLASECRADAVKFQKRTPELCVPEYEKNKKKETPWGEITYLEYKNRIEFNEAQYLELKEYSERKGLIFFASAWDIPSLRFLEKIGVPCHKISSAKLTDKELLLEMKKTQKPIILSTGMSTEREINKAVEILDDTPLIILHCCSIYPAEEDELNLTYISTLKKNFPQHIVGYSGHEKGISESLAATMLGAKVVERHITIDRTMWGTDHAASLEQPGLRRLVRDLKLIPLWLGDGSKRITDKEEAIKAKLRNKDTLFD